MKREKEEVNCHFKHEKHILNVSKVGVKVKQNLHEESNMSIDEKWPSLVD